MGLQERARRSLDGDVRGKLRAFLGWLIGCVAWLWVKTLRVSVRVLGPALPPVPRVVGFQHGEQLGLLAARAELSPGTTVLVSRSRDGDLQAHAMRVLGLRVVRGSSSRGALGGTLGLVRSLRARRDVLVAVDGPRGPRGVAKPGAVEAARLGGGVVVAVGVAVSRSWVLDRAWDRFRIPVPGARVVVTAAVLWDGATTEELTARLASLDVAARAILAMAPDSWQRGGVLDEEGRHDRRGAVRS